ncbi:phosphotransferase [Actinoplanes sp. NPDC051633]|uniref:phosphotransferase n=1 Tax=Actinoplanes sp. NPDC051633 TaxID=3155670 RepID=UPI00341488AD
MTDHPLASGQEADVYALDDHRVLRRYRRVTDCTAEAELMRYVGGLGYPVPEVHRASGSDMEMERLDGPTMAQAMVSDGIGMRDAARMLADLLRRLHELPPLPGGSRRILHLDLHPENVMLTSRGPVVIDWVNARDGEADLDTALSALIVAQVATDGSHPWAAPAADFLDVFLEVAPGNPRRLLDEAVPLRMRQQRMDTPEPLRSAIARVRGD